MHILDNYYKLNDIKSTIDAVCNFKTLGTFKNKYLKITSTLIELPDLLGQSMVCKFFNMPKKTYEKYDYDSDNIPDFEYELKEEDNTCVNEKLQGKLKHK